MADTKISGAKLTTPTGTDKIPLARVGDSVARYATVEGITGGALNVKSYGATGDGVTDDTAAFLAAADAVVNLEYGGAMYIPRGVYKITSTIPFNLTDTRRQDLIIYGDGGGSVIKSHIVDGSDLLYIYGNANGATGTVILRDFFMFDYAYGGNVNSATAIHIRRIIHSPKIENVHIYYFRGGKAIHIQNTWMLRILGCMLLSNKYGVYSEIDPEGGTTGKLTLYTIIDSCEIQGSTEHGVYFPDSNSGAANGVGLEIRNCIIEGNVKNGIDLALVQHVRLLNLYYESNNTGGAGDGDVYLKKCIFVFVENNYSVGATIGNAIHTDGNCDHMFFALNNWQQKQEYEAGGLYSFKGMSIDGTTTRPASWFNPVPFNASQFTFDADDSTPSIESPYIPVSYLTANVNPTTITNFDDGWDGREFTVIVNDANTTFDFSGSSLRGNGGIDFTAISGDAIKFIKHGNYWYGTVFDIS